MQPGTERKVDIILNYVNGTRTNIEAMKAANCELRTLQRRMQKLKVRCGVESNSEAGSMNALRNFTMFNQPNFIQACSLWRN